MNKRVSGKESRNILDAASTGIDRDSVAETVERYSNFYSEQDGGTIEARKSNYTQLTVLKQSTKAKRDKILTRLLFYVK